MGTQAQPLNPSPFKLGCTQHPMCILIAPPPSPFLFQRLQMDILLSGFSARSDFAGIFEKEVMKLTEEVFDDIDLTYINKLFELNHRMVQYLHTATVRGIGL